MDITNTSLQDFQNQKDKKQESANGFYQYLSFRFYKDNLEHLGDITRHSINNFLKSLGEIEDEFRSAIQSQPRIDLHDFGFDGEVKGYLEENY
jgi:hypothetical protein